MPYISAFMLHVAGYFLAVFIGFSLGLVGGGGSILTIPVLIFFFGIDPLSATTYSLFIVGIAAASGSINHYRLRNVDMRIVTLFGVPSVIMLFIVRRWLLNLIPSAIVLLGHPVLSKALLILVLFSLVMLIAGISMIVQRDYAVQQEKENIRRLVLEGCITGTITGFIGIGGGFIIVPALVLFAGLPVKRAIGTSLTIIIINCIVGILSNLESTESLNYLFLATFAAFAIAGILAGTWTLRLIPDKKLKPVFGWIILCMSVVIFARIAMGY